MARYSNHLENAIKKNSSHYQEGEKGREGKGGKKKTPRNKLTYKYTKSILS